MQTETGNYSEFIVSLGYIGPGEPGLHSETWAQSKTKQNKNQTTITTTKSQPIYKQSESTVTITQTSIPLLCLNTLYGLNQTTETTVR